MEELRIAWVAGTDPRVGMTLTPGHPTAGAKGTLELRDLDADLSRVARDAMRLVLLVTDAELAAAGLDGIVERGLRYGLAVIRRPLISARAVPGWLMSEIAAWRIPGPTVYADTSGRGRAAVAAAWSLVADGASVADAVDRVRAARGLKAIATAADRQRVAEFQRHQQGGTGGGTSWHPLPSADLRRSHLPPPRAPWHTHLRDFALSFDGYGIAGDIGHLEVLNNRQAEAFRQGAPASDLTLDVARTCLFFVERAWRFRVLHGPEEDWPPFDAGPYADDLLFAWALVERMRDLVKRP